MARKRTPGVYPAEDGTGWQVNSRYKGEPIRRRGFITVGEAEGWLTSEKERIRRVKLLGETQKYTLEQAAIHYVHRELERGKISLETEIHLLKRITRAIGDVPLDRISQDTVKPLIADCHKDGLKNKTINNSLGVVIRICTLAAREWRDDNGNPWLQVPPLIRKLSTDDQRPPHPISWEQQKKLLRALPVHLANMALFDLNTGARDDVVVNLQWEWEVQVPLDDDLTVSVFIVPKEHVKGKRRSRVLICNSLAQSIIEQQRGKHATHVFVYRRERTKNVDLDPAMEYRPIGTMNNTAWQTARERAGLGDLHVHDLRHTVGMRLREAGVDERTQDAILWHANKTMTEHYGAEQIREIYDALEKIKSESGRVNVSLLSLVRGERIYQNPTTKRTTG